LDLLAISGSVTGLLKVAWVAKLLWTMALPRGIIAKDHNLPP
jgi:hypothetical protein